jgi:hypothetical protein
MLFSYCFPGSKVSISFCPVNYILPEVLIFKKAYSSPRYPGRIVGKDKEFITDVF